MHDLTTRILAIQEQVCRTETKISTGMKKIREEFFEVIDALKKLEKHLLWAKEHKDLTQVSSMTYGFNSTHISEMMSTLREENDDMKLEVYHLIEELCDLYISSCKFYSWLKIYTAGRSKYLESHISFTGIVKNRDIPFGQIIHSYNLGVEDLVGVCFKKEIWKEFDCKEASIGQGLKLVQSSKRVLDVVFQQSIINDFFWMISQNGWIKKFQKYHVIKTGIDFYEVTQGLLLFVSKFFDIPMKVVHAAIEFKVARLEKRLKEGLIK